jgi:acyl carrier protein phosphodiesterase
MNHLAHLFLSGDDEHLLAGNFMGDSVKGRDFSMYPAGIAAGIRLHRNIDAFTDSHPVVVESKKRLRPHFLKYAPVVADMYYDHLLAAGWSDFSNETLPAYTTRMYNVLARHSPLMPERTQRFLHYMIAHDWLVGYATPVGLHAVLCGMARRARFDSGMERAAAFLEKHYDAFELDFNRFFPDLQRHVAEHLAAMAAPGIRGSKYRSF